MGDFDLQKFIVRAGLFFLVVAGQSMENICLPLALSGGADMAVVLLFMTLMYFIFFSVLDTVLDFFCQLKGVPHSDRHPELDERRLVIVALANIANGTGMIFGGSSKRTPLTIQMAIMMIANLLAARYKIWVYGIKDLPWFGKTKFHAHFWGSWALYLSAFVFVLIDRLAIADSKDGKFNAFCLFFVVGAAMAMVYNVNQDRMMAHFENENLGYLAHLKKNVSLLRRMCTWIHLFAWMSPVLASIPGVDQGGVMNRDTFESAWAEFLPMGNWYMNIFNIGYITMFLSSVFLNKIDSALTMTAVNTAAVVGIAGGWLPHIGVEAVGYVPNIPLTIAAIVFAIVGMWTSWQYSARLQESTARVEIMKGSPMTDQSPLMNEVITAGNWKE